jgi:hypothetical protein
MRKIIILGLLMAFVFSFTVGVLNTSTQAKPPIPCTYKCINQDWYFCCICPGTFWETCEFLQYDCATQPIYDPGVNPCD